MKRPRFTPWCVAVLWMAFGSYSSSQSLQDPPTAPEITEAYRSKSGDHGGVIPGLRWERWRIKEIRGWSLSFQRLSEKKSPGVLTRQYRIVARKNTTCAEYAITDVFPAHPNVQIKPLLNVEPGQVSLCR